MRGPLDRFGLLDAFRRQAPTLPIPPAAAGLGALYRRPPVDRYLADKGSIHGNPRPPAGAANTAVRVRDPEGWGIGSCFTAKTQIYLLYALQNMSCRVWVEHDEAGSLPFVEAGRLSPAMEDAGIRFKRGERLTFYATGPEASRALEAVRVIFRADPDERREIYRKRYRRGGS